jgi:hypothetical protein
MTAVCGQREKKRDIQKAEHQNYYLTSKLLPHTLSRRHDTQFLNVCTEIVTS